VRAVQALKRRDVAVLRASRELGGFVRHSRRRTANDRTGQGHAILV
jgi:hypothetical protein